MDRNAHHHHHHSHPNAQPFFEGPRPKPDPSQRSFKELHHPLIKAIWNVDRLNPNVKEKLKELSALLEVHNPNVLCDIFHEITGKPIAQATPLIIACFEGDSDVISLLIESNADVNQYESEHHLTPLHVICDAEYEGQNLTVKNKHLILTFLF
jgi:ankyrin repeat protein